MNKVAHYNQSDKRSLSDILENDVFFLFVSNNNNKMA